MPQSPSIDCADITVAFGDFLALDRVDVSFEPGKIHALVGQNGAGKTTLARVIAGLVPATAGHVAADGEVVANGAVLASRAHGIEMVHQSFALPPSMTVAEALEYGSTRRSGKIFSRRRLNAFWQRYLDESGVAVSAEAKLRKLPIESLQAIEIARALAGDARTLILDEPTAVLPPDAISRLFDRVRRLRDSGVTVIIVLHKVREVLEIADTVTVLRRGQLIVRTVPVGTLSAADFAATIVGTPVEGADAPSLLGATSLAEPVAAAPSPAAPAGPGTALVQLREVTSAPSDGGSRLSRVDLELFGGQIVGVAGVEGNGQVALAETIAGIVDIRSGELRIAGTTATALDPLRRRALGLRIIPFDRNTQGLSGSTPLWQNWAVPLMVGSRRRRGPMRPAVLKAEADAALRRWDVRFRSVNQKASELSGGNAQKVIMARELDADAKVIIAAQPTRGLDLGAVEGVWRALRDARDGGAAVLLISSDLDELIGICDRIIVLLSGEIVLDEAGGHDMPYDMAAIGRAMTGAAA
ncbi:ABC transporter ATP-binding protein [Microbacterium sp. SORGH_AS_0888]|uniref:ABC transporter ATP-binding protein n=1 Tax=Microbacterium sp. SORGH_AS_0888 TaxID=3041791 RepID=UPI0027838936|nr:ATP-binding cassette domain-containing protein [Microbacterium sp. SORGH_AS_0888]MDQ1130318.1 ABC-type uncharacterized transport system ATPase subunit [Microbacterium sp. SORGH_AS_0888]